MGNIAVKAEHLAKQFRIGRKVQFPTLRDSIAQAATAPLRWLRQSRNGHGPSAKEELIWALEDISFEIQHGELVGIIGRNGAGKSTLLKILSRITEPTRGRAMIYGRVGSLLEVGTGFHPELTGRENIFLNGAILGMRKAEIQQHFDAIVDFAEVERFIDTPVKRYSSGMYLRLAFAVAAHLQPEILIVDEVLAVGDARFQKKCLNKMEEVGSSGRTVLFVSHNMQAVTRLCKRTIYIEGGRVYKDGPSHEVVGAYLQSGTGSTAIREWPDLGKAPGNDIVRMCAVRVKQHGEVSECVDIRYPVSVEIEFEVLKDGCVLSPSCGFHNHEGVIIMASWERTREPRARGRYLSSTQVPGNFFAEGTITVGAGIITEDPYILHANETPAVGFQVVDVAEGEGISARGNYGGVIPGIVRPLLEWRTNPVSRLNCDSGRQPFLEWKVVGE
jgi:lipopolysaccharide transport system ATP-binding protein